jgi:hypothetical protein
MREGCTVAMFSDYDAGKGKLITRMSRLQREVRMQELMSEIS